MKIRGLLLKDIYELWAQSRVLLLLIAAYLLIPALTGGGTMLGSVGLLLLAMLPASAIGYDERSKWERYALTMPVTKRQLHAEKFLLGFLALTLGAALQLVLAFAFWHTDQTMIIRTTLSRWVMCSDLSFLLRTFFDGQGRELISALVYLLFIHPNS